MKRRWKSEKKSSTSIPSPTTSELLFYTTQDGKQRIEVRLEGKMVWLSQAAMVELFQTTKQNISLHLKNIFAEGELDQNRVVKEYLTTAAELAKELAYGEYDKFSENRKFVEIDQADNEIKRAVKQIAHGKKSEEKDEGRCL